MLTWACLSSRIRSYLDDNPVSPQDASTQFSVRRDRMSKDGSGNSGRRNNAGGHTGSKAKSPGSSGKNGQHGSGGHHSQNAKGNGNSGGYNSGKRR